MAIQNSLSFGTTAWATIAGATVHPVAQDSLWTVSQTRQVAELQCINPALPLELPPATITLTVTTIQRSDSNNGRFKVRKVLSVCRFHMWDDAATDLTAYPVTVSSSFELPLVNVLNEAWYTQIAALSVAHMFGSDGSTLFSPIPTVKTGLPVHPAIKQ